MVLLRSDPDVAPAGVTPLPTHAWLPLRAFVHYPAFEQMMKSELSP